MTLHNEQKKKQKAHLEETQKNVNATAKEVEEAKRKVELA